jgi:hypothetical protein
MHPVYSLLFLTFLLCLSLNMFSYMVENPFFGMAFEGKSIRFESTQPPVVVPVLGVNVIPVRIEETVSTSFPLGKALFTVLMMKSGCTDYIVTSSQMIRSTIGELPTYFGLGVDWTGTPFVDIERDLELRMRGPTAGSRVAAMPEEATQRIDIPASRRWP